VTSPATTPPPDNDISPVAIVDEMERSYLDYAMSVIVSRALPDVRDGLKPVHRRILYAMNENGYVYNRAYRKSARIVGDVMGQYHPHGDSAIYDAMVRMAQTFSMRLMLIDGQGNFGSMDGDKAAAMRYTEARLSKPAHALLEDIDKETVDFQPNYDENSVEPVVLPARFPNLLVNGAGGIAVGMATNLPPHNLGEVIDACLALIDDPDLAVEDLLEIVPGPDFPTGALVMGKAGIRSAYLTGRGSIVMRARCSIEAMARDREAIVVTEMPYQVNKAAMIEKMAEMVRDKKLEGISDIRDESDRSGVRVVIEVKRDAQGDVVLNQLYRYTQLQTTFGVNMLALNQGRPEMLTLMEILKAFVAFREEVIRRRTIYELGKARDRAHVLAGLAVAVVNVDPAVQMIRSAPDPQTARERLMAKAWPVGDVAPMIALIDEPGHEVKDGCYMLSETQARAILDLRLHRLTGLEREKIHDELREIGARIEEYLIILASREKLYEVMRNELVEVRDAFATPRRTELQDIEFEVDDESLIAREDMVVTVTNTGYIKRVPLSTYRAQRRGGKGRSGMAMRDEDFVTTVFVANTHAPLLFFSSAGIVYKLKVHRLPLGTPQARGKAMVNMLPLGEGETISTIMAMPEDEDTWGELDVMFATASGNVRRNKLSDFTNIMANGKIAMKLEPDDSLIGVMTCSEDYDVMLGTHAGKCIRFSVGDVRVFAGRTSTGVRGVRLDKGDRVISLGMLRHVGYDPATRAAYLKRASQMRRRPEDEDGEADHAPDVEAEAVEPGTLSDEEFEVMAEVEEFILTVTEHGFGKRSSSFEYRVTGRGGKGIVNIDTAPRNGNVVASFPVGHDDQIMLITNAGKLIRMPLHDVRIASRKTLGVRLFRTGEGEVVVSAAHVPASLVEDDDADLEPDLETGLATVPAPDDAGDNSAPGDGA